MLHLVRQSETGAVFADSVSKSDLRRRSVTASPVGGNPKTALAPQDRAGSPFCVYKVLSNQLSLKKEKEQGKVLEAACIKPYSRCLNYELRISMTSWLCIIF
ncbi:hypothetical protein NIES4103_25640 [Nostoc sp. NIES-4103]|nr:hypothetical protein NIES4103_25640 [Nostoc sp. NIES-4103]